MRRRRFEEPEGEIVIPVTPMLDMTFQLLIFFIVTFNPNRIVEGFWPVEVADEISTRDDKLNTGTKNDAQVLSSQLNKELTYTLKVHFDENNARSYYPRTFWTARRARRRTRTARRIILGPSTPRKSTGSRTKTDATPPRKSLGRTRPRSC